MNKIIEFIASKSILFGAIIIVIVEQIVSFAFIKKGDCLMTQYGCRPDLATVPQLRGQRLYKITHLLKKFADFMTKLRKVMLK